MPAEKMTKKEGRMLFSMSFFFFLEVNLLFKLFCLRECKTFNYLKLSERYFREYKRRSFELAFLV